MKTVINAQIIFESDSFASVFESKGADEVLTIRKIVTILKNGNYELSEVLWNPLMNNVQVTLVIKHKEKK